MFDITGSVDIDATMNAQTDPKYGTTWTINDVKTTGEIEIQLYLEHQDPLVVQVETRDRITNALITDVNYKITESQVLPATGSTTIQVGYALESGVKTYKLDETQIKSSYADITDKLFRISYSSGKVSTCEITSDSENTTTIAKTADRTVKIVVYAEPKVPFEIKNLYYFNNNTKLQGANFKVISIQNNKEATGTTDSNGAAGIYCDILGQDNYKIYKVIQTSAATGYATVEDFYVKVHYDANQVIDNVELTDKDGNNVTNKFVTVSYRVSTTQYNKNNKGIVTLQVLNYPEFKINIENLDRRNDNKIAGTNYSVKSTYKQSDDTVVDFTSTNGVITDSNGIGIAHLDKTKEDTIVTYKVKEDKPAVGYQSYGSDIDVIVTFNQDGYVTSASFADGTQTNQIAKITLPNAIVNPEDNFVVNLQLKNNPILEFELTALDSVDQTVKIKDIGFQIVSRADDNTVYSNSSSTNTVNKTQTPQTSYTDINGVTKSYLDRTLENKTMYYTIKEVQKSPGYEWADEDIVIAVTYDSNGKISAASVTQGTTLVGYDVNTWIDKENFKIKLNIFNNEIKEFGIHLTAADTYDTDKKLNDMKVEAFLAEPGNNGYTSDGEYELIGQNALQTGIDRDNNGLPDLTYGEDYETMGQYTKGAGTRTLRLIIKNDSKKTAQSGYYLDSSDGSNSGNNVGYYKGTTYFGDAKYQTVKYEYLINVTFDDEGKIVNAKLNTGHNLNIGWLSDERYIQVDENKFLSHTDYKLNITMKFFPMLDLKLNAMDNYTYEDEVNTNGKPVALQGSRYTISTTRHYVGTPTKEEEYVTAGYIGDPKYWGSGIHTVYGDIYEDTNELLIPIENNHTRLFFVFEEAEPFNYQKYTDRLLIQYEQRLTAIISVTFNEYGEIDYDNSIVRKVDENIIKPYMAENGTTYLSSNNIKEYNYYFGHQNAKRDVDFYIGYGLTTKLNIKAIDDIANSPISNIRMYPFINNTYNTNTSYEYNTNSYRYTNYNGDFDIKYWGASEKEQLSQYIIRPERTGNNYNGYLFPSDMASATLGGSGSEADYYAKLDVTYGSDGKIAKVTSVGHDLWGDNNIKPDITWDSATGNIYINMLFSRKFQVQINKSDYYDSTINNLSANFDVISNKGLNTSISSNKMVPLGKVYKDETVKYTMAETLVPSGYYPLEKTIDFYVTFNENGDIGTNSIVTSDANYFETISTSTTTKQNNKTSPDLVVSVKDKPAFTLDLRVIDKFYKNDGIKDINLNITNSKGDTAIGSPQTDNRGYANNTIVGPVYPNEEVVYYIKQTNKAPDYYRNSVTVELHVRYNDAGKIEEYWLAQNGSEVVDNFDGSRFNNTRRISMNIMNMPETVKIGLYKYDKTTNAPMAGVPFTITKQDVTAAKATTVGTITTNQNGSVIEKIDTFNTSLAGKVIKYTIHEDEIPESFRAMEDIVFLIRYNADGSMTSCNQIANARGIVNTNVTLDMAVDGRIRQLNGQRVHFKLTVPNDNSFDLIIKDEDTNYSGLGIEGSKFDVSINGLTYNLSETNQAGKAILPDITQSGELTINIAQREIGEGYKYDVDNIATINLQKGENIYSLDLLPNQDGYIDDKNATTTKAVIKVDEEYGKIEVTFKNETKTELTLIKQDVNTSAALQGAVFTVEAVEIDSNGNPQGNVQTLTTVGNDTTNQDGKIHFELGVAPQSQIWKYTFKEITPPAGYNQIVDLDLTVTYDQYGRISNLVSSKEARLRPVMATDNYNCHSIYAIIKNGDISPAYTVKVVTEDSQTRKRINGSKVFVNITEDATGNLIPVTPKTTASVNNGVISETKNLGIDGLTYTDKQINELAEKDMDPIIVERGLTYIDNVDFEGTINIEVSQKDVAPGYVFGSQHTDGNIKIETTYVPHLDDDPTVSFRIVDDGGFGSLLSYDETNRIITIKILNESNITFDITTQVPGQQNDDQEQITNIPIQGASYNITAEIQTYTDSILTDINEQTSASDENGKTYGNTGEAFAEKTVIYRLHQNIPQGYRQIDDIIIEIQFDSRGYIKYIEPLSSENNILIDYEKTVGGRIIYLTVNNIRDIKDYKIFIEKHANDTDEENMYGILLPGAKYHIIVNQEDNGINMVEWTAVTDENGMIELPYTFDGTGYITITLEELEAPEGYKVDSAQTLRLRRDRNTGRFEQVDGHVNFEYNEETSEVYIKPINSQAENKYTLIINKFSTATNMRIKDNQAQFKAELIKKDDNGNITYQEEIENIFTDNTGKAVMDNLTMPEETGTYTLKITEEQEPTGYKKLENPIEIEVTFGENSQNNMIIESVNANGIENASISTFKRQLIGINIQNDVDIELAEDEYLLDITKVDGQTMQGIEPMAVFKVWLPDENNTAVYTETQETLLGPGKLDYCYIEQDKDYKLRLTHMKKPTIDEIKASEEQKITHTYKFQEVAAPDGYALDTTLLTLEIDFEIKTNDDGTQEVIITDARTSDDTKFIIDENTITEQSLAADILNDEQASSYKVHYDPNTDDVVTNIPADQSKLAGVPLTIDANIPERTGYTFKEWNTEPDGSGSTFNPADTYALDADVTLYAIWDVAQYTIEYVDNAPIDPNTGVAVGLVTGMPYEPTKQQTKTHDVDITLDDDNQTPTIPNVLRYYEFAGWNTASDGTGTHYDEAQVYDINQDLTLYAQWNYIISYVANIPTDSDGFPMTTPAQNMPQNQSLSINDQTDPIIDDLNVYTSVPTIDGYVFKEWNTKKDGTGTTYNPNDVYGSRQGIVLYAIWQYQITYHKNTPLDEDGFMQNVTINNMPASPQTENVGTAAIIANTTDNPQVPVMVPDNYTFKEWNTKKDGTGDSYNPDDVYNGNISITLYAIWEESTIYLKTTNEEYMITDATITEGNRTAVSYNTTDTKEYNIGDKYLIGILPQTSRRTSKEEHEGTTLALLKTYLDTNGDIKVYKDVDKDNNLDTTVDTEISDNNLVGTGMFLHITKGKKEITLRLVVRGDSNGDGMTIATDATIASKYIGKLNHTVVTQDYYKLAFDADTNGRIMATDDTIITNMASLRCKYAYRSSVNVTLDTDGGSIVPINDRSRITNNLYLYKGATYETEKNYGTLPDAKKEGYTFIGWFDEDGNQVTKTTIVTNTFAHTLKARYN